MKNLVKFGWLLMMVLAAALILAACSTGYQAGGSISNPNGTATSNNSAASNLIKAPDVLLQTDQEGAVTVQVKWDRATVNSLIFDVAMDTHSVNVDQYDLKALATLRDDSGREYQPTSWNASAGGHHRSGTLTFPLPKSVSQGQAKYIELVIRNIDGIQERVLKWQL